MAIPVAIRTGPGVAALSRPRSFRRHYEASGRSTRSASERTSTRSSTTIRLLAGASPDRGLIDTSVAIALEDLDGATLPAELAVSTLTLAELAAGPHASFGEESVERRVHLRRVESQVECLDFDDLCARAYGRIYAATRAIGRKPRGARCVDLMIAATALAHALPLYTLNAADLRGLGGLVEIVGLG